MVKINNNWIKAVYEGYGYVIISGENIKKSKTKKKN